MFIKEIITKYRKSNRIAIEDENDTITYGDLYTLSVYFAECIRNDFGTNKNIGLMFSNSIKYVVVYFAISLSDNYIVPVDMRCKENEIIELVNYTDLGGIILSKSSASKLKSEKLKCRLYTLDQLKRINRENEFLKDVNNEIEFNLNRRNEVELLLRTSGSTGRPKRTMLTSTNLRSNVLAIIEDLRINDNDVTYIHLPLNFASANTSQLLTHLYVGGKVVFNNRIIAYNGYFEFLKQKKITNTTIVPSLLKQILLDNKSKYSNEFRYMTIGGASISKSDIYDFINLHPTVDITILYGLTEASPRVTHNKKLDFLLKPNSVGKAIPNVKIGIFTEGVLLSDNTRGEICVNGPSIMHGYYGSLEKDKFEYNGEEWLQTGDLGYMDEDGYLYIDGRIKNIIIKGGVNISPEEIERHLEAMDGIKDALVYGVSDDVYGEVPMAKLVLKDDNVTKQMVLSQLSKVLSIYKLPHNISFVDKILYTVNGKKRRD